MFRDESGLQMRTKEGITSNCEQLRNEQYYYDPLGQNTTPQGVVQPLRTMIRSLDTLNGTAMERPNLPGNKFKPLTDGPTRENVLGWAPEVEILSE